MGSLKGNDKTLLRHLDLCWDQDKFKLLGVKFSLNLSQMIKNNYEEKLREIRNLLIQWSKRILTPYGRITVVKSLALAKINHLLLALPNPSEKIVTELNTLFFRFIWNGSIDRVKRDISIKKYSEGGLKTVKVEHFMDALKISWIRRFFTSDAKWKHLLLFLHKDLQDFANFGPDFIKNKLRLIHNKFWVHTFEAWVKLCNKIKVNSWTDFLIQPLWLNNKVKVGGSSIFYKHWFKKGIIFIHDLLDSNGQFFSLNYIQNTLGIKTNFIEYQGLINSIISSRDNLGILQQGHNITRPNRPIEIKILMWDKKGGQLFYKILTDNTTSPSSQTKWQNELLLLDPLPWKKIYNIPYKVTKDPTLRWFQYRLTHRILSTNTF